MVGQINLGLRQLFVRDAKTAQRTETRIDSINGAWLGRHRFDQLPAPLNQRTRFGSQRARRTQRGDLPDLANGEVMAIERDYGVFLQAGASMPWTRRRQAQSCSIVSNSKCALLRTGAEDFKYGRLSDRVREEREWSCKTPVVSSKNGCANSFRSAFTIRNYRASPRSVCWNFSERLFHFSNGGEGSRKRGPRQQRQRTKKQTRRFVGTDGARKTCSVAVARRDGRHLGDGGPRRAMDEYLQRFPLLL